MSYRNASTNCIVNLLFDVAAVSCSVSWYTVSSSDREVLTCRRRAGDSDGRVAAVLSEDMGVCDSCAVSYYLD